MCDVLSGASGTNKQWSMILKLRMPVYLTLLSSEVRHLMMVIWMCFHQFSLDFDLVFSIDSEY